MSPTPRRRDRAVRAAATLLLVAGVLVAGGLAPTAAARAPSLAASTDLVSVSVFGSASNRGTSSASMSSDGTVVAFSSASNNLIADDNTNGVTDVFVRDMSSSVTSLVSVAWDDGKVVKSGSHSPSISADGRYIAFWSGASNLTPGDTNGQADVFVRDLSTGTTTLISVSSDEEQANGDSLNPSISRDGRYVAFESTASNLVGDDLSGLPAVQAIFVRDCATGRTHRISVSSRGEPANRSSGTPAISADGRFVAFMSSATDLVPGDTNGFVDVYLRDRRDKVTTRVSVGDGGVQANWRSESPTISANGRHVAFASAASNLVWGDTNRFSDVFVHDSLSGLTRRMSLTSSNRQANHDSFDPVISADGEEVAFSSYANLEPGFRPRRGRVFVRHRLTKETEVVSLAPNGDDPERDSYAAAISADGTVIAFQTMANNFGYEDHNGFADLYLRRLG